MKLSILDQAPISANQTPQEALFESMKLAQAGERLGYTRYWIAEHHDLSGLACPAPEVMLGYIGAQTKSIRIGSGAVLLPHYKPYKVAEVYNMLATLFPNRIDIGIGRAPGGSAEAANALSDNFLQQVWKMPELIDLLLHFIHNDFPADHEFANLIASPIPSTPPVPWLLGTSKKSAILAAEKGVAYTFGLFMSDNDGVEIVKEYINNFTPRIEGDKSQVIVTVSAICAETKEKAEDIALSSYVWAKQKEKREGKEGIPSFSEAKEYLEKENLHEGFDNFKQKAVIGTPKFVKERLQEIKQAYQADEIMIVTITHSPEDRIKSYELIAREVGLATI
ncbi:LLM class flavin-dependent oxidoreductase [Bacillus sp. REN16]|uniref:LLM class flavin-dependent oxidoreductase n=1 Tax=Bacillus sp. REN16 TaxID=2887296 RepID=UPI001E36B63F|nr:LLM class flavin-dependent oxidoreductase [Bacillus sp. REN16]MCC3357322.1 LLM class flavin-dependent oxidoreductase [Bacillus sp. REN16]